MAARETVLTPQGLEDLKAKIELLRTERRREVAQRIKEAREFGDISENSEYDDAKNEQAMLEKQISDLEEKLRGARVIDEKQVDTDVVGVGVTVHVKDQKTDKSSKYRIVGSAEADPAESKLSNESPVGKALLGHKRGETDHRAGPPRPRPQAQDHQDRTRIESPVVDDRRAKLERLRAEGIDPFPHAFHGVVPIERVHAEHADLADGEETDSAYRIAGRLAARRGHGGAAFLDVVDRSGRLQVHARKDVLGDEAFETLVSLDLGDLIGVDGTAFRSRRGELSLRATGWTLLAKSLRNPPDKFHGLEDVETRYRHRELDLLANEETRELFTLRSKVVSAIRRKLDERGFLEVETPVLQPLYGGALARPFVTHHNELDRDLFLRIADELYLKRLIVGGLERVYEIGKDFRNEGVSHKHNPEFTMLEWYEAYADYDDIATRLEELIAYVAEEVGYDGPIDFSTPWRRVKLRRRHPRRDRGRRDGAPRRPGRGGEGEGDRAGPGRDVGEAGGRPALEARGAEARAAHLRDGLPEGAVALRQGPPLRARAGRALRVLRRRDGVLERLLRAERPGRAARAFRAAAGRRGRRRRGDAALRRGLRARARAGHAADRRDRRGHRPAGDDPQRPPLDPRGRALPRDEGLAAKTSLGAGFRGRLRPKFDRRPLVDSTSWQVGDQSTFIPTGIDAEEGGKWIGNRPPRSTRQKRARSV